MSELFAKERFSWCSLGWLLLYFWFFSCALQLVIVLTGHSGTTGLRDSLLYSLLWLLLVFVFPARTRIISGVLGILLWSTSLIALGYYSIYKQEFSQSVMFVMFESNSKEAGEYVSQYFSLKVLAILFFYTVIVGFLWRKLRPVYLPLKYKVTACSLIVVVLFGIPLYKKMHNEGQSLVEASGYLASRMSTTAPWQYIAGYVEYRQQLGSMTEMLRQNAALPPLANLKDANGNTPRTLVLVIGESTTSSRMSLYGYGRQTTPRLDALRKSDANLVVFNDVVTSRPYTIEILQQALTFADEQQPDLYLSKPSLMNMMKQAGYKTFWITNQQTMTKRNTLLTVFSQQTDEQFYMNNQRTQSARQYDDVVFAPFEKVLTDPAEKKFIVVHLLGTHMKYKFRYPEEATQFVGREGIPDGVDDNDVEVYNDYDNAELYNDYVLETLIRSFEKTQPNGFLLYFSDHGEDVYETPPHNVLGRNETAPTRTMYTVPFILWTSPQWQKDHPIDYSPYVNRKYSNAHLLHTWSTLAGLSYDLQEPEKSLVSPVFRESERWIGNPYSKKGLSTFDSLPYTTGGK
ncbi:phosphoethanolamine transferase CptA [Pectobacterium versatile]|uniref:Phosphoethanolamine transferase n=1 Tax=Pectobacterium versatile TaxID=2488639 RepID=A0A855MFX5_9GAMM|nr:phosphoethanolamine transferase CptA [Pectobacterium versatile]MBA0183228.1 phosphoethanolamine transferase CptA [Pectobacterium versatile]POY49469.1 phosphoethanolamine transferase [Pectobacterium versatile]QPK16373.1 phosphoethanolamine transferase CptA [Pectobacterium versatile]